MSDVVLSFFKINDRAILSYIKNGTNQEAIVQILETNKDSYTVKAPTKILNNINGIMLLDRKKYGLSNEWSVMIVSSMALAPCKKPELKNIKGEN